MVKSKSGIKIYLIADAIIFSYAVLVNLLWPDKKVQGLNVDHNSCLPGVNTRQDTMRYTDVLDCSSIHVFTHPFIHSPICSSIHSSIHLHSLFFTQNVEVKDFSNSWANGLALCAILHSFLPDVIPYDDLSPDNPRKNYTIALQAAE